MDIARIVTLNNADVVVIDSKGKQIGELQGDVFISTVLLAKYDLDGVEIDRDIPCFQNMLDLARDMRKKGFTFNWAEQDSTKPMRDHLEAQKVEMQTQLSKKDKEFDEDAEDENADYWVLQGQLKQVEALILWYMVQK